MSLRLGHKLMIYFAFVLPIRGFDFAYNKMQDFLSDQNVKYKITTLRKEYSNLKRDGFVETKTRYHKPIPVLTQKGKLEIKTHLPFKAYGPWDEKWRIVFFDIPEKERKYRWALRDKLNRLGFGKLQKSVYITPYPLISAVNRFASDLGIRQYLRFIEVNSIDDENKLVKKTWDLEKINQEYNDFIAIAFEILQKYFKNPKNPNLPFKVKALENRFITLYDQDPHLPEIFLPKNWLGYSAYLAFKKISALY